MDSAKVGVLIEAHKESFSGLLESNDGRALESQVGSEFLHIYGGICQINFPIFCYTIRTVSAEKEQITPERRYEDKPPM
jgi:hypothetical protein